MLAITFSQHTGRVSKSVSYLARSQVGPDAEERTVHTDLSQGSPMQRNVRLT